MKTGVVILLAILASGAQDTTRHRAHVTSARDTTHRCDEPLCATRVQIDGAPWCLTLGAGGPEYGDSIFVAAILWNPKENKYVRDSLGFAIVRFLSYRRVRR